MENKINFQPPLSTGFPGNAGSPREAAIILNKQPTDLLVALGKTSKGGKGRKKNGGTDKIVVPLIKTMYHEPANGTPQATGAITLDGMSKINQMHVDNAMTGSKVSLAAPIPANQLKGGCGCDKFGGGKRGKRRKGGTHIMGPNQTWGCYSGGRTRKTRNPGKTRKTRKPRKIRKTRKTRKTK